MLYYVNLRLRGKLAILDLCIFVGLQLGTFIAILKTCGRAPLTQLVQCISVTSTVTKQGNHTMPLLLTQQRNHERSHNFQSDNNLFYANQQPPQRGGAVPDPVWVGSKWLLTFRGSQLPRTLPFIFSLCCLLNDRRRAAHSFFKIGRLSSLFLFSCPTLALLRLLILLFLLMSGNVHSNPGPTFPCSVCAGNLTWRGKSVQCCTCSKWVHLRCSQLSLSNFRALGSYHSWSCPPAITL